MRQLCPIIILTALLVVLPPAAQGEVEINRLKLRDYVTVCSETVTLGDVLSFQQVDPRLMDAVGHEAIGPQLDPGAHQRVSHNQVVQRLDELGVNLSRVLVSGALECQVTRSAARPVIENDTTEPGNALLRGPSSSTGDGPLTLADTLRAYVNEELSTLGGTADLKFDRAGAEFLQLTTPPWQFNISSSTGSESLGLREFRVVIRRDGRVQRTAHIFAHVRLTRQVVVARRPLSIGNYIRSEDVTLETRVFDQGSKAGVGAIQEVIGQQVKRFVASGDMLDTGALKMVDLVRRSRPVTVIGANSSVQVRLTGVALDSGGYGDSVRVRLGDSRLTRQQVRGVVTGLGTVRLMEEAQ